MSADAADFVSGLVTDDTNRSLNIEPSSIQTLPEFAIHLLALFL